MAPKRNRTAVDASDASAASTSAQPPAKKKASNPVKRWCFTLNNYTDADLEHIKAKLTAETCDYAIVGKEVGESGTPHLQGFANLKKKVRLNGAKDIFTPRAHLEVARGTDAENEEYCSKRGDIYLAIGEPSFAGKRNDLNDAIEMLQSSHGNLSAVAVACPATFIRYGKGLATWVDFAKLQKPRDWKTELHVYVGPPGCGKSRTVHRLAEEVAPGDVYYKTRGEWWDGYVGQKAVVIDDFYGWLKYDELLRIADRYPLRVPIKGAFAQFVATHVFITSNVDAWEWYKFEKCNPAALMRRVSVYQEWCLTEFKELKDTALSWFTSLALPCISCLPQYSTSACTPHVSDSEPRFTVISFAKIKQ